MGQPLSRRPPPPPTSAPAPGPDRIHPPRRSLPRRILSSISNPSLRSRSLPASLALPTRPEQTLRGKNRRWWPSRRSKAPASTDEAVPEHMDPITEHDEHQVDRDVDEFGVITHRVPDNHTDSPVPSAKGKEKAKDVSEPEDDGQDDDEPPVASSSAATQSEAGAEHVDNDEVVIAPTVPPSPSCQPSPLPLQDSERTFVSPPPPPPPLPMPSSPPHSPTEPASAPRPFPPPGTLVVVQGVVHTTDVLRASERPVATSNPTPPTANDPPDSNPNSSAQTRSPRPSSVPPSTRSRHPLSGVFPRPSSMIPAVPSSLLEPATASSNINTQGQPAVSNVRTAVEDSEDEDRAHPHPHGLSMAQGPVGGSGLSASSIDVLGTLLSVAAAATAASLLTGSSEPIFSSGLTSTHPPPSSNPIPSPLGLNANVPSERPLSPTPTSDAGRMRHVWSSLRDRLGLGGGAHNSNNSNETSIPGPGQVSSQSSDLLPRDPREIMLAEMARAFNLGLGLNGSTTNAPSVPASTNTNGPDFVAPDAGDVTDRDQPPLPPPDSFERFLMDLQTDLRATLMQEQDSGVPAGIPRDAEEPNEDEEDQSLPDLQSLSDPDSDDFEMRHSDSGEDESSHEEDIDQESNEEDVHTAEEQLSGRTSPALSALATGIHSPFGIRSSSPSSLRAGRISTAPSQSISTAMLSCPDGEDNSATDNNLSGDVDAAQAASCGSLSKGSRVTAHETYSSNMLSEEGPEGAVLGMAHSPQASNGWQRVEAEGRAVSGTIAVPPPDAQHPSNVPRPGGTRESLLPGTSSSPSPLTFNASNSPSAGPALTTGATRPSTSTQPSTLNPEPLTHNSSSTNVPPGDSTMPFRLPFIPSSASRTEHTPGGGINWWRMYRFPAIAPPSPGHQGGPLASSPLSQSPLRIPTQGPSHPSTSPWVRSREQNQQNESIAPRGVAEVPDVHTGLAAPAPIPAAAPSTSMPELVFSPNQGSSVPPSANAEESNPRTNTYTNPAEHRGNVVVPVIVVGLQSVNMDRQPPHMPSPPTNHTPPADDEDGDATEFDGMDHPMSMPMQIPEPAEFHHQSGLPHAAHPGEAGQQPARGRTWQSRAANAIRNLRPSRRTASRTTGPQPQEPPGSRTFLIYVIGGYYPPDHQIITGGNLDSFEALWELAELLGQVKPPTVSKEEIEKSGLEIIKASVLAEYEKQGRVASNCVDRCLICLDDYNPEDELRVLTCKHTFHQGCVDKWLETGRNNCPACRTKGVANNENAPPTPAAA